MYDLHAWGGAPIIALLVEIPFLHLQYRPLPGGTNDLNSQNSLTSANVSMFGGWLMFVQENVTCGIFCWTCLQFWLEVVLMPILAQDLLSPNWCFVGFWFLAMLSHVAFILGYILAGGPRVLCGDDGTLGSVHSSHWRPRRGHEDPGFDPAGDHCTHLHFGHHDGRQAADSSRSHPSGASVPGLPQVGASTIWGRSGDMERSQSMGFNLRRNSYYSNAELYYIHAARRPQTKVLAGPGTRGRDGVSLRAGGGEGSLLLKVCGGNGQPPGGGRGSLHRTAFGFGSESDTKAGDLCRLRGVGALLTQTHESGQVSILPVAGRRQLLEQDDGRAELLPALASIISSSTFSVGDAWVGQSRQPGFMGSMGGEAELSSPWVLASHRDGGRPSKRRTHVTNADEDKTRNRSGGCSPLGMAGSETMECGVASCSSRQRLLDGASHGASHHVGSKGTERLAEDSTRGTSKRSSSRRSRIIDARDQQGQQRGGHQRREEGIRQEKGSKKEEKTERQRRTQSFPGQRKREGRWKGWRTKGFWRRKILRWSRRGLLCLEQWQWALRRSGTRGEVHGQDSSGTQMFSMWLSWPPQQRLHFEEGLSNWAWGVLCWMVAAGDNKETTKGRGEMEGEVVMKNTDKVDLRGPMHTRSQTKRKRFTGDDPPGGEEDPPKKKIHVEGDYLTVDEYFKIRTFSFLHHFSGKRDRLSEAIKKEAGRRRVKVETVSVDREGTGEDLSTTYPFGHHLVSASRGELDGYHSGFPCHTYSKLLWREAPGMPGPVRSKEKPYGLEGLPEHRRRECDLGTVLMARSVLMAHTIVEHDRDIKVPAFVTMENPPPSDVPGHISAWHMPEMVDLLEKVPTWRTANYNTCAFQPDLKVGEKHYKPGMIGGTLPGILKLGKRCSCGFGKLHEPITGKEKSSKAAAYTDTFCEEYAKLVIDHFVKMGLSEFWEGRARLVEKRLEVLKMKAAEEESLAARATRNTEDIEKTEDYKRWWNSCNNRGGGDGREEGVKLGAASSSSTSMVGNQRNLDKGPDEGMEWKTGPGKYGMLKEPVKRDEVPGALIYVGGLRNPHRAVPSLPTVQALGLRLRGAWDRFLKTWPKAIEVAEKYGAKDCCIDERLVTKWKEELKKLFGARGESTVRLRGKQDYVSPIDYKLLEAWRSRAGDPETFVTKWLEEGAPLGIEEEIGTCGIFPPAEQEEANSGLEKDNDLALASSALKNYKSVEDDKEGAEIELSRYEEERYLRRISREEAKSQWGGGTISRLGMVVKTKDSGEVKRRIEIDLRRSGGNAKSKLPEKLVLPRLVDFVKGLKDLRKEGVRVDQMVHGYGVELALIDIHDAFTVFPVNKKEWRHTLAPSTRDREILLFQALLFGYKVAPLLYSRFAAMLGRLLQSGIALENGVSQIYLDDTIWAFQGDLGSRSSSLAFTLYTLAALGARISLGKGARANQVTWVGVAVDTSRPR